MMGPVRLWRASDRRARTFCTLYVLGAIFNLAAGLIPPIDWWALLSLFASLICLYLARAYLVAGYRRRDLEMTMRLLVHQALCRHNSRWN